MGKRKNITKTKNSNILGIILILVFTIFSATVIYKFISIDNLSLTSDQVWCANCQTYHDRETAENENENAKLVWCINCNRYHEPRDESK